MAHNSEIEQHNTVYLLEVSSPTEERLLRNWLRQRSQRAVVLRTSGPGRLPRPSPEFDAILADPTEPRLAPVRVIWHPPHRGESNAVRWRDLLPFGDPRTPGRMRQWFLSRFSRHRFEILEAPAASVSELRARWQRATTQDLAHTVGLSEFVCRQAALALERAERRHRGARYKVPRFVIEEISARAPFRAGVAAYASQLAKSETQVHREAIRYLHELAATPDPTVIDLVANLTRRIVQRGYRALRYSPDQLARVQTLTQKGPVCFLPAHRSNLDHLVLFLALYENGLPPNHTAGGINMNFFPVGPLVRRSGVFFIRRTFRDNELYKFVLRQYVDYLLEKRFSLEWYIEGGRSRSGKLLPPRYGILSYVVDAYRRGKVDEVYLVPVSITYDQIQDLAEYATEHRGGAKTRESWRWLVRVLRRLKRRYGDIHLRIAPELALSEFIARESIATLADPEETSRPIQKLAFELCVRIARATPLTPTAVTSFALLSVPDRALTAGEVTALVADLLRWAETRELPTTAGFAWGTVSQVTAVLEALVENEAVSCFRQGEEPVYLVSPEQQPAAGYYRNTVVHFFLGGAIAELALFAVRDSFLARQRTGMPVHSHEEATQEFWRVVFWLRDLLKFDFFFPDRQQFREEIDAELRRAHPDWQTLLAHVDGVDELFHHLRPLLAPASLRPFLETYWVAAQAALLWGDQANENRLAFVSQCGNLARQLWLQRRIRSTEPTSRVLLQAAVDLASYHGLLGPGVDPVRRKRWADQLRAALLWLDSVAARALARFAEEVALREVPSAGFATVATPNGEPASPSSI